MDYPRALELFLQDDQPAHEAKKGQKAVHEFLLTVFQSLQKMESGKFTKTPPLLFTRLDISVMPNDTDDGFDFFVNEVTRAPGAVWFAECAESEGKRAMQDFGFELKKLALTSKVIS